MADKIQISVMSFANCNIYQELFKLVEEVGEVAAEFYNSDRKNAVEWEDIHSIACECADVLQATVNLLCMLGYSDIQALMDATYMKNKERGYYAE